MIIVYFFFLVKEIRLKGGVFLENTNFEVMEKTAVWKAILKLSIPTVLSTIISILYNITDTYFIGLLDDPVQLGAISLAFPVFMILQAVGNMFGNGAPSYISRCLGSGKIGEVKKTSAVSVYSSVILTVLMTLLFFVFKQPILHLLGTSEANIVPTGDYLSIVVGLSFILILQVVLPSMLRAEGRVKEAVIGMILGTVLNIVLDPIFILVFRQGVAGAAWATMIGNFVAVIYYIAVYIRGNTVLSIKLRDFKPNTHILSEVLKIGLPMSVSQAASSFAMVLFNNLAAAYGDYVISAYGVAVKMITMEFMIIMGYVSGYMPFAGYNFGARNTDRMISALKFTMLTGTALCVLFLIPFTFLARPFMNAFTSSEEIINVGVQFLNAQAWAVPFMAVQMTMMSTFQATGEALRAMIVNLGRQCLLYIPLLYIFNGLWHLKGLLHVQMAADLLTTAVALIIGIPLLVKLFRQHMEREVSRNISA